MAKHTLVKVLKRTNKETQKDYYLAYFVLSNENSCDLINVLITEEQANQLRKYEFDKNYDFTRNIIAEYNSYQKKYVPRLVLDNQK